MKKVIDCVDYYYEQKDYNCAESVFAAAMDAWGLEPPEDSIKMMSGFGKGLASTLTCGAICGATAAIGYRYTDDHAHQSPAMVRRVHKFVSLVEERMGATDCRELRPKYYVRGERCRNTIHMICQALDDVCPENDEEETTKV